MTSDSWIPAEPPRADTASGVGRSSPSSPASPLELEPDLTLVSFRNRFHVRFAAYIGVVLGLGLLGGLVWKLITGRPTYAVGDDGVAVITDQALGEFFAADGAFVLIGLIAGLVVGTLAWYWLRQAGWRVAVIAVLGASVSALVAWRFGVLLGPEHFVERIASAQAGDQVGVNLALQTPTAWLVWPFAAITPVLLYSALGRDEEAETAANEVDQADSSSDISEPGTDHGGQVEGS